jgi:ribonuclease D
MKGARSLKGRQLAVLRAVFQWREGIAAQLDRAPFRVAHNDTLLAVAKAQPRSPAELQEAGRLSPDMMRRWGEGILGAVESGLRAPQNSIPVFERARRPPPDAERDARLDRLKAARNGIAQRLDLAPGVLCANGILEAIAQQNPSRPEQLEAIPDMRRWQREVLGRELIEAAKVAS